MRMMKRAFVRQFSQFSAYVPNIGRFETRQQHDGRVIGLLLPETMRRKHKLEVPNIKELDRLNGKLRLNDIDQGLARSLENIHNINYVYRNGLRYVEPYVMVLEFVATFRRRYSGEPLDIASVSRRIFPGLNQKWIEYRINNGLIRVNLEKVDKDYVVQPMDHLSCLCHVHEAPVLDQKVEILLENEELIAVNKPSSYVIYPMTNIRLNSLTFTLEKMFGKKGLKPMHRLDKLTSGVCILAKSTSSASRLTSLMRSWSSHVTKEYLVLVDGKFPDGTTKCDAELTGHLRLPLVHWRLYPNPKRAFTTFELIEFDGNFSLVKATIETGKTHQIRLHLRVLGFGIVNDTTYNPRDFEVIVRRVQDVHYDQAVMNMELRRHQKEREKQKDKEKEGGKEQDNSFWSNPSLVESLLTKCVSNDCVTCELGDSFFEQSFDSKSFLFMCLHSHRYTINDFERDQQICIEAPLPDWAIRERREEALKDVLMRRERQSELYGFRNNK